MNDLVRYDAMCTAIAVCEAVDEVLEIHDQARALEVYAKQARNTEAERKACNVRIRAERRTGELLVELARAQGLRTDLPTATVAASPYQQALTVNDLPDRTARRYQQLAAVPADVFEAAMSNEAKPSTRAILDAVRDPMPQVSIGGLWIWGRLRDFERDHIDSSAQQLLDGMTAPMQADVRRIAPVLRDFLGAMLEVLR